MAINNLYQPQDPILKRKKKRVWKAKNWQVILFLAGWFVLGWKIGVALGGWK